MGSRGDFLPILSQISGNKELKEGFVVPEVFNDFKHPEFFAGDTRVMENTILTTWHTMMVRLHNLCVANMPDGVGDNEVVFNECRLFVIGAMQKILYEEQFPALIGETAFGKTP